MSSCKLRVRIHPLGDGLAVFVTDIDRKIWVLPGEIADAPTAAQGLGGGILEKDFYVYADTHLHRRPSGDDLNYKWLLRWMALSGAKRG